MTSLLVNTGLVCACKSARRKVFKYLPFSVDPIPEVPAFTGCCVLCVVCCALQLMYLNCTPLTWQTCSSASCNRMLQRGTNAWAVLADTAQKCACAAGAHSALTSDYELFSGIWRTLAAAMAAYGFNQGGCNQLYWNGRALRSLNLGSMSLCDL